VTVAPLLVVLSLLGADATPGPWKPLFSLPSAGPGPFVAIWADESGSIVAVGREVIVQGTRTGAFKTTPLPPTHGLFGVWGRRADDVFAVGPRQLIMHFTDQKWITERPRQEGNPRRLMLYHIGPFLPDLPDTVVAYGPGDGEDGLKRVSGAWTPVTPPETAAIRRREQRDLPSHKPCRAGTYQTSVTVDGQQWVQCHDRSVLLKQGDTFVPRGHAPKACMKEGVPLHGSAIWKGDLFVNCGRETWRNHGTEWVREPAPEKLRSLFATPACLYAATDTSILARCD